MAWHSVCLADARTVPTLPGLAGARCGRPVERASSATRVHDVRMARPCVLLAIVVGCLVLAVPAVAARPRLAIVRASPVTVRGTGFVAHERVRLTVRTATRTVVRSTRAGANGAFTVRLAGIRLGPCGAIAAAGSRGDHASLTHHRGVASCEPG